MKLTISLLVVCSLLLVGCSSTNPNNVVSHAAFKAAVTLSEQIALEAHPEVVPHLRVATSVVCATANGTNVNPSQIVADLQAAGITNATAKIIINSSIALLNVAVAGLGTNQTEIRLYGQDFCSALKDGLPPENAVARAMTAPALPHLK